MGASDRLFLNRWLLPLLALLLGATVGGTALLLYCGPTGSSAPRPADSTAGDTARQVHTAMRNVDFNLDEGVVFHIRYLKGALVPARDGAPPRLEDDSSYVLQIGSAEIEVDTLSLSRLLNRHVLRYRGSPLRHIRIRVKGEELVQEGWMGSTPFTIRSTVSLTPDGLVRLHPGEVKVLGLGVEGLMHLLGLELEQILRLRPDRGMRVDGNDLLLDPVGMLPLPRMRGHLTGLRVTSHGLLQQFGPPDSLPVLAVPGRERPTANYMSYRGGTLRFGRLTMAGADLLLVDREPADPFGFSLARYQEQLVAGTARVTADGGLVLDLPDLGRLQGPSQPRR